MRRKGILATVLGLAMVTAGYGLAQAHGTGSMGGMNSGGAGSGWFGTGSGFTDGSNGSHMGPGGHMMGGEWGQAGPGEQMGGFGWGQTREGEHMGGFGWGRMIGEGMGRLLGRDGSGSADPWRGEHRVTRDQARRIVEYRLGDNPYVRIGGVTETAEGFQFEVVTKKGAELVDQMMVERNTGRTYSKH